MNGVRLDHVSKFKYLGCILNESGADEAVCRRKVTSGKKVTDDFRFLVNARDLQFECVRVLHACLFSCMLLRK